MSGGRGTGRTPTMGRTSKGLAGVAARRACLARPARHVAWHGGSLWRAGGVPASRARRGPQQLVRALTLKLLPRPGHRWARASVGTVTARGSKVVAVAVRKTGAAAVYAGPLPVLTSLRSGPMCLSPSPPGVNPHPCPADTRLAGHALRRGAVRSPSTRCVARGCGCSSWCACTISTGGLAVDCVANRRQTAVAMLAGETECRKPLLISTYSM